MFYKQFSILVITGLMLVATLPLTAEIYYGIDYDRLGIHCTVSGSDPYYDLCPTGRTTGTTYTTEWYPNGQVATSYGVDCFGNAGSRTSVGYYDDNGAKQPAEIAINDGEIDIGSDKELIIEIYDMSNIANPKLLHKFITKPGITENFQLPNVSSGARYLVRISDLSGTEVHSEQYYVK